MHKLEKVAGVNKFGYVVGE